MSQPLMGVHLEEIGANGAVEYSNIHLHLTRTIVHTQ